MSRYSKSVLALTGALLAVALQGCATGREIPTAELKPREIKEVKRAGALAPRDTSRPKIALVLGGGGLRGFAHVGVLRAVEEFGIKPDLIVGTSAGAVVGAAYASGLSSDQVKSAALDVSIPSLIDLTWSRSGLIRGRNLASWIDEVTGGARVETFPRRFAAVATDLKQGRAMLLDTGPAGSVVRASSAVPGMNVPVPYPGGHLVDGGVTSLVPVRFARALGAEVVIAVDIYCRGARAEGTGIVSVLSGVMKMQSCLLAEPEMTQADLLIAPEIAVPNMSSMEARERIIRAGYEAASTALENWRKTAVFDKSGLPKRAAGLPL